MSLPYLPVELLDQIMHHLDPADVALLMACNNRQLVLHYERRLYIQPAARNSAMLAACNLGLVRIIRRLVLDYGAPASTVDEPPLKTRPHIPRAESTTTTTTQLTLYHAARNGHLTTCHALVDLGARTTAPGAHWRCQRALLHAVFQPANDWALLHFFYERRLEDQTLCENRDLLAQPIVEVIHARGQLNRPPLATLRMLLERAPPAALDAAYLSAALTEAICQREYDPLPVLDLVLSEFKAKGLGAGLDEALSNDLPVFAAVQEMALRGVTSGVEWCISHGADLNKASLVKDARTKECFPATPAQVYIICLDFWSGTVVWDPVDGLEFLLARGASLDNSCRSTRRGEGERFMGALWALKYLLTKWGVSSMLTTPTYRRMIEFLFQLDAQRGSTSASQTLGRCAMGLQGSSPELDPLHDNSDRYAAAREATLCAWQVLVKDIVLSRYRLSPTQLLVQFVLYKGANGGTVEHLTRATMDVLLDAGADINGPVPDASDGSILLHELCREVGRVWRDAPKGCGEFCTFQDHVRCFSLITLVLSKGAKRLVRTNDGRTAKELFLESLDTKQCERLARLATMLG
ncbi:hypothetical protein BJX64DRAFT_292537 [Aspergillus heterothallicus]